MNVNEGEDKKECPICGKGLYGDRCGFCGWKLWRDEK